MRENDRKWKQFAIASLKFLENLKNIAITGYSETGSNPSGITLWEG